MADAVRRPRRPGAPGGRPPRRARGRATRVCARWRPSSRPGRCPVRRRSPGWWGRPSRPTTGTSVIVLDDVHAVTSPDGRALVRSLGAGPAALRPPRARDARGPGAAARPAPGPRCAGRAPRRRPAVHARTRPRRSCATRASSPSQPIVDRLARPDGGLARGAPAGGDHAPGQRRRRPPPPRRSPATSGSSSTTSPTRSSPAWIADLRDFLVRLSVADRFDAGLAAGAHRARRRRRSSSTAPSARTCSSCRSTRERRWYRLHGLFADCLRAQLSPAELAAAPARRRRAGWRLPGCGARRSPCARGRRRGRAAAAHGPARAGSPSRRASSATLSGLARRRCRAEAVGADADLVALDAWLAFYSGRLADAAAIARSATSPRRRHGVRPRGACSSCRRCSRRPRAPDAEAIAREGVALLGADPLFRVARPAGGRARPAVARRPRRRRSRRSGPRSPRRAGRRQPDGRPAGGQPPGPCARGDGPARRGRGAGAAGPRGVPGPVGPAAVDRVVGAARAGHRPVRGRTRWRRRGASWSGASRPRSWLGVGRAGPRLGRAAHRARAPGDRRSRWRACHPPARPGERAAAGHRAAVARRRDRGAHPARAGRPRVGGALGGGCAAGRARRARRSSGCSACPPTSPSPGSGSPRAAPARRSRCWGRRARRTRPRAPSRS